MEISVFKILESPNASLHDDGLALYREVISKISDEFDGEVKINFEGIKRCSTLFLNASFGKLLAEFGEDFVKKFVHPYSYSQILNFTDKFNDMWENFQNKDNYQAYREEAFA